MSACPTFPPSPARRLRASLTAVRTWENPTSFQIIAPGLDARFSGPLAPAQYRFTKTGTLTEGDLDNVTNFSKGKLEDEIKQ